MNLAKNIKIGIEDALLGEDVTNSEASMVINTNVSSVRIANMMRASVRNLNESVARLSSGSRIVNPADDAAGLAVATKFTSQVHRIDAARNSAANTLSFVQTADGYMQKVEKAFSRMGELAALARDRTKSATDLENYNKEFQDLKKFIIDVQGKQMNGRNLFQGESIAVTNGAFGETYSFNTTDLTVNNYARAVDGCPLTPPPFTWEVSKDVWVLSKSGYLLREDAYKITQAYYTVQSGNNIWQLSNNAWYKAGTGWSATDNGGTKYNSGALVKLGNGINHDIQSQLGAGAANYFSATSFITKTNPVSTPPSGNIEASDIQAHAANTFSTIDPAGMGSSIAPTSVFYQQGSFTTINPSPLLSTNISAGGVVAVNPKTSGGSGEDNSATLYAAGSTVTSDPTDSDVDPDAEETSESHVMTSSGAYWAIKKIKNAMQQLSTDRASSGSVMGRLHRINDQLGLLRDNLNHAISRIRDTNVAAETTRFARHQILVNTSTDMLKQANIVPQHALRLILGL